MNFLIKLNFCNDSTTYETTLLFIIEAYLQKIIHLLILDLLTVIRLFLATLFSRNRILPLLQII